MNDTPTADAARRPRWLKWPLILPAPADAGLSPGDWMRAELRRPPLVGDGVRLGPAMPAVRELRDGRIASVGLGLTAP